MALSSASMAGCLPGYAVPRFSFTSSAGDIAPAAFPPSYLPQSFNGRGQGATTGLNLVTAAIVLEEPFQHLDDRPALYDTLFWGNNLPSMTPKGKHYDPNWAADEIALLAEILSVGLNLFESYIRSWPHDS